MKNVHAGGEVFKSLAKYDQHTPTLSGINQRKSANPESENLEPANVSAFCMIKTVLTINRLIKIVKYDYIKVKYLLKMTKIINFGFCF